MTTLNYATQSFYKVCANPLNEILLKLANQLDVDLNDLFEN
jgi:hypothetical protein